MDTKLYLDQVQRLKVSRLLARQRELRWQAFIDKCTLYFKSLR